MRPSRFFVAILLSAVLLSLASTSLAQSVRTLYNFNGNDGSNPANLTLAQGRDGLLYGGALYGGTNDQGVIFKITPAGTFTVLHNLYGLTDGIYPGSLTLGADGNFYGAAQGGGTGDYARSSISAQAGALPFYTTSTEMAQRGLCQTHRRFRPPTATSTGLRRTGEAVVLERSIR